jgi:hypothetical protein
MGHHTQDMGTHTQLLLLPLLPDHHLLLLLPLLPDHHLLLLLLLLHLLHQVEGVPPQAGAVHPTL